MKMRMHLITIGIVAASVAAGACNGEPPARGNALATPSSASTPADASGAPVATVGRADASRPEAATPTPPAWREVTIPAGTTLADRPRHNRRFGNESRRRAGRRTSRSRGHGRRRGGAPRRLAVSAESSPTRRAPAKVKGRAHVAVRFDSLTPSGDDERYEIRTTAVGRTAAATKKDDAVKIGAPAAGGAIIGAIAGGKKGALIGTAVGGGAGTAVVLSTRGKEVQLAKGAPLTLQALGAAHRSHQGIRAGSCYLLLPWRGHPARAALTVAPVSLDSLIHSLIPSQSPIPNPYSPP